ncbi:hypothetical protein KW497_03550 [Vibrio fluvialis]|nr:hypothetical protein [Vibrio fluvialis]
MAKTRERTKGRQSVRTSFAGIPRRVMESEDFRSLSGNAVRLLLWMSYQYKGKNNGDLAATHTLAQSWGIGGKQTLVKALKELQMRRLISMTRQGKFTNPGGRCALYALTWLPVDECLGKELEIGPTRTPLRTEW